MCFHGDVYWAVTNPGFTPTISSGHLHYVIKLPKTATTVNSQAVYDNLSTVKRGVERLVDMRGGCL